MAMQTFELPIAIEPDIADIVNMKLPDPALLQFYKNQKDRIVWIDYDVDTSLLNVSKDIIRWNMEDNAAGLSREDRNPIVLIIFTDGGALDATFNFIDVCSMSKTPIITVCSKAYSAGVLLLLCGHKRYALPMSDAMIHSGSSGMSGTFEQMSSAMENYKDLVNKMRAFILSKTNITPKTYKKNEDKDRFLDANKQLEYGLVDAILTDFNEIFSKEHA